MRKEVSHSPSHTNSRKTASPHLILYRVKEARAFRYSHALSRTREFDSEMLRSVENLKLKRRENSFWVLLLCLLSIYSGAA